MAKLNGSAKWIGLALAIACTVVTVTLTFAKTNERVTVLEVLVKGQKQQLERMEDKIDKLLERGK